MSKRRRAGHAVAECENCGAQSQVPCEAITVVVNLVLDKQLIVWQCQLCGHIHDMLRVPDPVAAALLDGGATLAAQLL